METNKKVLWAIDPVHTRLRFDTKYLLLTSVSGWFKQFEGTVAASKDDFSDSEVHLTLYTSSIDTGNEERDNHLKSEDFFNAAKYPTIEFHSTHVTLLDGNLYVTGNLTIKDTSHPINFLVTCVGVAPDPMGNTKAGFVMDAVFNRQDFHVSWNLVVDKYGILISDEVALHCDMQLLKLG